MASRFTYLDDDFSTYTDQELKNLVDNNMALSYLDRGESLDLIAELAFRWKRYVYETEARQEGGHEEF